MDLRKIDVWPMNRISNYIETAAIVLLAVFSMSLMRGSFDSTILLSPQLGLRILGTLLIWFANKFTLEYILQNRINFNKVTQFLPFELTIASLTITSTIYFILYPILIYLNDRDFDFANLLQGLFATCGLSLLIVVFYAGIHVWKSWWSDGDFLFRMERKEPIKNISQDFITVKDARGTINHNLKNVLYFISESKIVFLVDISGKKWMTQYNLSELDDLLDDHYFRLNRRILVSRQVIHQIKKLPNHRLLVTIGPENERRHETVSRYKSTRFKQWFDELQNE